MLRSFFVDDFSGGANNVENGDDLYKNLRLICLEAGFNFLQMEIKQLEFE